MLRRIGGGTPEWGAEACAPRAVLLDETLLELLPAGVYVCEADGTIVRFNRRATELWGRAPRLGESNERFCGARRLYWPDGRPLPHEQTPMAEVLRTGRPVRDLEVVIEQPGGARVWAQVSIEPLFGAGGELAGAVNCFQDVTARRRSEAALRQSQAFLQAMFETTPEFIKVVAADGRLVQVNPAGLATLEAEDEATVLGRQTQDFVAPEHREAWQANHRRVCAGEKLTWEFDIIGLRGGRRNVETHAVPLALPDGTVGHLGITRDITCRKHQEQAILDSERQLRELLEALPTAVYTTDAEGRITFFNQAAVELWGRRPQPGDLWCGSWRLYRPDGAPLPHDACPMAIALREGRAVRNVEAVLERPDGTRLPFMPYPTPLRDASGAIVGAVNMLVDITHHKDAADRQQLLINELNHRVKNTLATVQSIANLTLRTSASPAAFRDAFASRIAALSTAHDLLTSNHWQGAGMRALLEQELAPYIEEDPGRVVTSGAEVRLDARQTLTLAMAFHELATNAAKYGALATAAGRLEVRWSVEAGERLRLLWSEHDGPPVAAPGCKGFGSTLLERSVAAELGGSLELDFAAAGLRCAITAPLRRPSAAA